MKLPFSGALGITLFSLTAVAKPRLEFTVRSVARC
jgi:hypothetical protein